MRRLLLVSGLALGVAWGTPSASAFALLGSYATWMTTSIGYQQAGDSGGPMNLGEEYRINLKTIYYGFDSSFLNYFGTRGVTAIEGAIKILNDLPPASQMDLSKFPLTATRQNYRAAGLLLVDIKSVALQLLLEQMGLAESERWIWCLRNAWQDANSNWNYITFKRNFDPDTWLPTSYVNGTLYTYRIQAISPTPDWDAIESSVDPLLPANTSISGRLAPSYGEFFTGLTRDDVGGLKYIYSRNNYNVESPTGGAYQPTNSFLPIPGYPIGLTNSLGTNALSNTNLTLLRSGIEKITFVRVNYDSYLGQFTTPLTNTWVDEGITNGTLTKNTLERVLTQPDILFAAADLQLVLNFPFNIARTTSLTNNATLNPGNASTPWPLEGPGVISPPNVITFSKIGPNYWNGPGSVTEVSAQPNYVFLWGSFDGTTNPPIVFPDSIGIREVEQLVRQH